MGDESKVIDEEVPIAKIESTSSLSLALHLNDYCCHPCSFWIKGILIECSILGDKPSYGYWLCLNVSIDRNCF